MARTVKVRLELDAAKYKRGAGEAERATTKLSDAIEEVADNNGLGQVSNQAKGMGRAIGGASSSAARDLAEITRQAAELERQIGEAEKDMRSLARGFANTGDTSILAAIQERRRTIAQLSDVRKLLPAPEEQRRAGAEFGRNIAAGMKSLPGAMLPVAGAAGAAAAPVFLSSFSAVVSGGTGAAVLGVGLRAVAEDPVVKERGTAMGKSFVEGVNLQARNAFQGPVLESMDKLEMAGRRLTINLGSAFQALAPQVGPLTDKLIGAGEALTNSLTRAAANSAPALDAAGDSMVFLAEGTAGFIDTVSQGGPEAAANLRLIAGASSDVLKYSGLIINVSNQLANNPWLTGPLLPLLRKHYADAADSATKFGESNRQIKIPMDNATRAANGQRSAMVALSKEMQAQIDPAFGLLNAQAQLKEAQDKSTAAIRKHGRNSAEAKEATRDLAMAALDLQAKAGALGDSFDGELTPAMRSTFRAAQLTEGQIDAIEKQMIEARGAGDKFAKRYSASVTVTGDQAAAEKLARLVVMQRALSKGVSMSVARAQAGDAASARDRGVFAAGGWTGPGATMDEAGIVHADEFVIKKASRRKIEQQAPGALDEMNATGRIPGYARGGLVLPFPVTAAGTRIPSRAEVERAAIPAGPTGTTGPWMERLLEQRFGQNMISGYRPGSRTLSGNLSYHARNRAVDFPPNAAMARFMYTAYKSRLKEAITPFPQYNVLNGRDHRYTGAVWRQHAFGFGNAHNHFAMASGGVIREPVFGQGMRTGATYSFAERGPERVLSAGETRRGGGAGTVVTINPVININGSSLSARQIADEVNRRIGGLADLVGRAV